MPAIRLKTFQIPVSREPKKSDVILLATMGGDEVSKYTQSSTYDGSSWGAFSSDYLYQSEPSYSNGFISFTINYFSAAMVPLKATYVTGWEDS